MSTIYYYTKNENMPIYLKYGIRLSKNFDKEFNITGYLKPYLIGYLNPRDSIFYDNDNYTCIKLDMINTHCKVIDYTDDLNNDSIIPSIDLDSYEFGSLPNPIVLIDTSIISDKISLYNKDIDIPLLYDNSKNLYFDLQIRKILDEHLSKDIYDILSNSFNDKDE